MQNSDDKILARLENKAVHYLGRYASTASRLHQVLCRFAKRKLPDAPKEQIDRLIKQKVAECISRGYIDDARFAQAKIASLRSKGASRHQIRQKLAALGVDKAIIDTALNPIDATHSGTAAAVDSETIAAVIYARRRRLGPFATSDRGKDGWQKRHLARLARAGFAFETARFVLNFETTDEAEAWLDDATAIANPID